MPEVIKKYKEKRKAGKIAHKKRAFQEEMLKKLNLNIQKEFRRFCKLINNLRKELNPRSKIG